MQQVSKEFLSEVRSADAEDLDKMMAKLQKDEVTLILGPLVLWRF